MDFIRIRQARRVRRRPAVRALATATVLAHFGMTQVQSVLGQQLAELGQTLLYREDGGRMLRAEHDIDPTLRHADAHIKLAQLLRMQTDARLLEILATQPGHLLAEIVAEGMAAHRRWQLQYVRGQRRGTRARCRQCDRLCHGTR